MADKGYTTEEKIENYLKITITDGDANDAILAAQNFIDNLTGRNFKADTTAVERLYNGDGSNILIIDDCVDISKVEIGSDGWGDNFREIAAKADGLTDYYIKLPNNYDKDNLPIRKLLLRSSLFVRGVQNQKITAKFGWSVTPPSDIIMAATVIAAGIYQYGRSGAAGGIKSEKIGEYSISFASEDQWKDLQKSMVILQNYKKHEI